MFRDIFGSGSIKVFLDFNGDTNGQRAFSFVDLSTSNFVLKLGNEFRAVSQRFTVLGGITVDAAEVHGSQNSEGVSVHSREAR